MLVSAGEQGRSRQMVWAMSTVTAMLLLYALALVITEETPSATSLLQKGRIIAKNGRLQKLEEQDDDANDLANGVDFGEESGVGEAIDTSKDDISSIKAMVSSVDDGSNPLKAKLGRLIGKVRAFQEEEDEFYKSLDSPTKVDIEVTQGPPGKKGPTGHRGREGAQGPPGTTGIQGLKGAKGPPGVEGPQGPQGLKGPKGPTGDKGPKGIKGPQGEIGVRGARGPTGQQGPPGAPGVDGAQGLRGQDGAQGVPGPPGKSMMGPPGPVGPPGPPGTPGVDGLKGALGNEGPQGEMGARGPQGPTGGAGPPGKDYTP